MSLFRNIERIKAQIVDTERMLDLVIDHPLMYEGLKDKLLNLQNQLQNFPKEVFEPKIQLMFSGNAVKGSIGIKSTFIGKTLKPFQEMIKTQSALVRFGSVAGRGQAKKGPNAELYLTALPIGSFGVELSQLDSSDLFEENEVANAMKQVMRLVNDTAESDEVFETAIANTPKRNLSNLKKFLKEIAEEKSVIKMECGELGIEISEAKIEDAYYRVAATVDEENEEFISGILRGFLLDSGKFEIQDLDAVKISGFISECINEEELIQFDHDFLNKNCRIHLRIHKTKFRTNHEKIDYELLGISNL